MKARYMWAVTQGNRLYEMFESKNEAECHAEEVDSWEFSEAKAVVVKILVLPLDEKSVAALVEKVAKALYEADGPLKWKDALPLPRQLYREEAQAALAAIGIKSPTKQTRKKR